MLASDHAINLCRFVCLSFPPNLDAFKVTYAVRGYTPKITRANVDVVDGLKALRCIVFEARHARSKAHTHGGSARENS